MGTPRLSPEELQRMLESGDRPITLIDVRPKERHDAGHVPGTLHIPVEDLEKKIPDLSKDNLLVTYCGGGTSGDNAAGILAEHGFDVKVMEGFRAWKAAGLPVEKG